MLEIMQFLSLFTLINIQYTPAVLLSYYESLSVATLEFLPNIFRYTVPAGVNPENDPSNGFTDNFRYHPNIFPYISPAIYHIVVFS